MGEQMAPSDSKNARPNSFWVSSAIADKQSEAFHRGDFIFFAEVESSPLWEIDFDKKVVTIPVRVVPPQGLLDAIEYFKDERNRVVMRQYR